MSTPQSSAVQTTQRSVTSKANTQICYACLVSHLHAFKMTIHSTIPKQTPKREFLPSPTSIFRLIGLNQLLPGFESNQDVRPVMAGCNSWSVVLLCILYQQEMLRKHAAERREVWPKGMRMRAYSIPRCVDETERRQG